MSSVIKANGLTDNLIRMNPAPFGADKSRPSDAVASGQGDSTGKSKPVSSEQIQQAVSSVKQSIELKSPGVLAFSVDETSGKSVVKITDAKTGETIRQIPSQEFLELARSMDKMKGILLRNEA